MVTGFTEKPVVEQLLGRIHRQRLRETVDPEVKVWVDKQLKEYNTQIRRVAGDDVYQNFLLTYITRQKIKFQEPAESRANPYGEDREKPLCTCGLECAIQSAEQPVEFRQYDNLDAAIRAFKRAHPGDPLVLDDARNEWYDMVAEVEELLRLLVTAMVNNEIPEFGDSEAELLASLSERRTNHDDNDDDGDDDVDSKIAKVAAGAGDD